MATKTIPLPPVALSRKAIKLVVLVGDETGSAPTSEDEVDWLRVTKIDRRSGASQFDSAEFIYDLGKTEEKLVDSLVPKKITRQVEVREVDKDDEVLRVLFWGKLYAPPTTLGQSVSMQWLASIAPHHYGKPLGRFPYWNPVANDSADLDRPLVFNPEIDERILPNCSNKTDSDRDGAYILYDVAGPNTAAARTTHGLTFTLWKLYQAAHLLIWTMNEDETFIKNPTRSELFTQIGSIDLVYPKLKNVRLKQGLTLPEALDELLTPFGVSWCVSLEHNEETDVSERKLKFFVRNVGTERELKLQRPAESLDPAKTHLADLSLKFDINALANRITGTSSLRQREITAPLQLGWPVSEDSQSRDDLENNITTQKNYPHAGRRLVMNESGAHTGLRPEITTYYSLAGVFSEATPPIARKLLPCLSRVAGDGGAALESRGVVLQYRILPDTTWRPSKWSSSVLEQEAGVHFETIPKEIWAAVQSNPANVEFRVTATIEGDRRMVITAEKQATSPNADDIELHLDLSDKFHDRDVHSSSIYYLDRGSADTADDYAAMTSYLERIREREDAADLTCSATLEGLDHPEYQIGDLITKVTPRNLTLVRSNVAEGATPRYLQVMGMSFDVQSQRMELSLESYDQEQV